MALSVCRSSEYINGAVFLSSRINRNILFGHSFFDRHRILNLVIICMAAFFQRFYESDLFILIAVA